mgnify:CR=1 FL=1
MVSKFGFGVIVTAVMFLIGIIMMSIFKIFSQEWLIGIAFIAGAIGVIALSVFLKMRK